MTNNDILYCTHGSAFQVNNLLQVAQKFQTAATENGPAGVSNNDAQTICNMLVKKLHLQCCSIHYIEMFCHDK
jgi:hypothetical protein